MGATSAVYEAIQKKIYRSGMTTLINSYKEMEDIMKTVKTLEEVVVSEIIENKSKGQKWEILGMLIGTLGAILPGNLIPGKAIIPGQGVLREG